MTKDVGKSSLIEQFVDHTFSEHEAPSIGNDFKSKSIDIDGLKIKLEIWDTPGQDDFNEITRK